MPADEYKAIIRELADGENPPPKARDPFDSAVIPGYCDGDYPSWLQSEMDEVIPAEMLRRFGKQELTMLNGSYWHIPEEALPGMTRELEKLGWEIIHAPELAFH